MSKELPCKNCWEPWKALPVYQTPPPLVIPGASIEPVEAAAKLAVNHCVFAISLSLLIQEHPLELVGKLENLPVPSFQDCEIAKASKFKVVSKFLCSVDNNCKATWEVPLLNIEDPIFSEIVFFISSFLNFISTLDG